MLKKIKLIINKLIKKKITLSVVESCTGGLLSQNITSVTGVSKIFKFGIITYSNQSKIQYLKVNPKIIQKYGAVSKECCRCMVVNLEKISKTKINIAITGIAGPSGGSKKKPVGLVYIGIKKNKKIKIEKYFFKNQNRKIIRDNTVKKAFELISIFI